MGNSNWLDRLRALVLLVCCVLVSSCSQAPPEPASEFTLPISQVSAAPPSPKETTATASAPRQLRYIAVPPGQSVAGMAHARIVVKHKKATSHRHVHKSAAGGARKIKKPTETADPAAKP